MTDETRKALPKKLQISCFHLLRRIEHKYYRYQCLHCGKQLRILSGVLLRD